MVREDAAPDLSQDVARNRFVSALDVDRGTPNDLHASAGWAALKLAPTTGPSKLIPLMDPFA
jgi:hypothetical protein